MTVSIDLQATPEKVELSEPDALRLVLAELRGAPASPLAAAALEYVVSPEGVRLVLEAVAAAEVVSEELRAAFHLQWTVRGHRIREAKQDDRGLAVVLRRVLPPYQGQGLTIFRGEQSVRAARGKVGFNWSTDRKVAEMFASGL